MNKGKDLFLSMGYHIESETEDIVMFTGSDDYQIYITIEIDKKSKTYKKYSFGPRGYEQEGFKEIELNACNLYLQSI